MISFMLYVLVLVLNVFICCIKEYSVCYPTVLYEIVL